MNGLDRYLNKVLKPIRQRINMMIARGVLTVINDTTLMQECQADLLADETTDKAERFQNYGFTSVPLAGSECLVVFPFGNRDHPVILAAENRAARKKDLDAGDVAMYAEAGSYIHIKNENGKIYLSAPDNIIIQSDETIRLDGKRIELHATESIKWDVGGRGYDYYPFHTDTFENCTVPGSVNDCAAPEHGDIAT